MSGLWNPRWWLEVVKHPRWILYELGLRRQAMRKRAWRCVLLGHRCGPYFSAFCIHCGDLVL